MKLILKGFLTLFALLLLMACSHNNNQVLFNNYMQAYYHQTFANFSELLADSITLKDGDYEMTYSKQDYQVYFKWDSTFHPRQELLEVTINKTSVDFIESVSSERYQFLGNNPLVTRKRLYFTNDKISMIDNVEYLNVDWNIWIARRDTLVKWIDMYHPELNGFIYDMTKKGAEDYKKAIALEAKEKKHL